MDSPKSGPTQHWMLVATSYVLLSAALALISLTLTGFQYGVQNNLFHIPYVLRLSETREFSTDAFYGSLRNFTSIVWPLLRTICTESNVREVFKWADFFSRAGAFAGMLFLFRSFGLKSVPLMTACLTVAAVSPWLQGLSLVGGHGMFISYFTQTEVTWGFVLLSVSLLALDRLPLSFAMTGIIFAINAFVGIWMLVANSLAIVATRKSIGVKAILGSIAAFVLFAAPVAIWIGGAVHDPNAAVKFSYIYYIRQFYPDHFLIEAISAFNLARFALLFLVGLLAALLAPNRRFWLGIQAALMLVFLVGIPLPYVLDNRFVFNLHILRSAGIEQAVAIILAIAAGATSVFVLQGYRNRILGLLILLSLMFMGEGIVALVGILLALLVILSQTEEYQGPALKPWLILIGRYAGPLTWVCGGVFVLGLLRQLKDGGLAVSEWLTLALVGVAFGVICLRNASAAVKQWSLALVFLCFASAIAAASVIWPQQYTYPLQFYSTDGNRSWLNFVDEIRISDIHGPFLVPIADEFEDFQLRARRTVWIGDDEGAAVMWSPSFYGQWMPRYAAVSQLNTPQEFVRYAQGNGIHNVVVKSETGGCPAPSVARIRSPPYLLCQL
jgi:hypothetical protein